MSLNPEIRLMRLMLSNVSDMLEKPEVSQLSLADHLNLLDKVSLACQRLAGVIKTQHSIAKPKAEQPYLPGFDAWTGSFYTTADGPDA
jgi:hypothetical protein